MEEDVETVIDRLQALVAARKNVSVKDAANALGISPKQIEKLASVLEESGLLRIQYSITGMGLIEVEDAEKRKAAKEPARKSAILEDSEKLEREVMTAKSVLEFLEKDLVRRVQLVEALMKELEKCEVTSQEELQKLGREINLILQQAAMFQEEVKKLEAKEDELSKTALEFKARLEALEARAAGLPLTSPSGRTDSINGFLESLKKFFENLFQQSQAEPAAKPPASAEAQQQQTVSEGRIFEERIREGEDKKEAEPEEKGIKKIVSKIAPKISKKR